MTDPNLSNRRSIAYLLGIDTAERWPDDSGIPSSPEDYGDACAWGLSHAESPTEEMLAALVHGAMKHENDRVRFSCGEGVARINPQLGKIVYFIQTFDEGEYVRDNAFEALWHIDRDDPELARRACDRLLSDSDKLVRETARRYKESDEDTQVVHNGPRGGQFVIGKDGRKRYLRNERPDS